MNTATWAVLGSAGAVAGAINSVAGGGSFVAFPTLLFVGVAPVAANATNTVALWPASVASAVAYRRELRSTEGLVPLGVAAAAGGLGGSILLLRTSETAFVLLIPWLLLFASALLSFGDSIRKRFVRSRAPMWVAIVAQLIIGVYGGYFGGGIGIMMLALLSLIGATDIHRMNAVKTVLAALINGVAVITFVVARAVDWVPCLVMLAGGVGGGYAGAAIARRIDAKYVRALIVTVAWAMTAFFFVRTYFRGELR